MEKSKKWIKAVAPTLICTFAMLATFSLLKLPPSGTDWIPGWPQLFGYTFYLYPFILVIPIAMVPLMRLPVTRINPKAWKAVIAIAVTVCEVVFAGVIALAAWITFSGDSKVDRYISSPDGKNKAVVLSDERNPLGEPDDEDIYPVRKRFFYERDKGVDMNPWLYSDITLTWLDDNTLEINRTGKNSGEVSTEYLRW